MTIQSLKKILNIFIISSFVLSDLTLPTNIYFSYETDTLRPQSLKRSDGEGKLTAAIQGGGLGAMHRGQALPAATTNKIIARAKITDVAPEVKAQATGAMEMIARVQALNRLWRDLIERRLNRRLEAMHHILEGLRAQRQARLTGDLVRDEEIAAKQAELKELERQRDFILGSDEITSFQALCSMVVDVINTINIKEFEPRTKPGLESLIGDRNQHTVAVETADGIFILNGLISSLRAEGNGIRKLLALFGHTASELRFIAMGINPNLAHILAEDFERFILIIDDPSSPPTSDLLDEKINAPESPLDESLWRFCEAKLQAAGVPIPKPVETAVAPPETVLATLAAEAARREVSVPTVDVGRPYAPLPASTFDRLQPIIQEIYHEFFKARLRLPSLREIETELARRPGVPHSTSTIRRFINQAREKSSPRMPLFRTRGESAGTRRMILTDVSSIENDWKALCRFDRRGRPRRNPYKTRIKLTVFAKELGVAPEQARERFWFIIGTLKAYGLPEFELDEEGVPAPAKAPAEVPVKVTPSIEPAVFADLYRRSFQEALRLPSLSDLKGRLKDALGRRRFPTIKRVEEFLSEQRAYRQAHGKTPGFPTCGKIRTLLSADNAQIEKDWRIICRFDRSLVAKRNPYEAPINIFEFAEELGIDASIARQRLRSINERLRELYLPIIPLVDEGTIPVSISLKPSKFLTPEQRLLLKAYHAIVQQKKHNLSVAYERLRTERKGEGFVPGSSFGPGFDEARVVLPTYEDLKEVTGFGDRNVRRLLGEINEIIIGRKLDTMGPGYQHDRVKIGDYGFVRERVLPRIHLEVGIPTARPLPAAPPVAEPVAPAAPAVQREPLLPTAEVAIAEMDRTEMGLAIFGFFCSLQTWQPKYIRDDERKRLGDIWRFGYLFLSEDEWPMYTNILSKIRAGDPLSLSEHDIRQATPIYNKLRRVFPLMEILAYFYFNRDSKGARGFVASQQELIQAVKNPELLEVLHRMLGLFYKEHFASNPFLMESHWKLTRISWRKTQFRIVSTLFDQITKLSLRDASFASLASPFLIAAQEKGGLLKLQADRALDSIGRRVLIITGEEEEEQRTIRAAIRPFLDTETNEAAGPVVSLLLGLVVSDIISLEKARVLAAIISRDDIENFDNRAAVLEKVSQNTGIDVEDLDQITSGRKIRQQAPTAAVAQLYNYIMAELAYFEDGSIPMPGFEPTIITLLSEVIDDAQQHRIIEEVIAEQLRKIVSARERVSFDKGISRRALEDAVHILRDTYSGIGTSIDRVISAISAEDSERLSKSPAFNAIAGEQYTGRLYINRLCSFLNMPVYDIALLAVYHGMDLQVRVETPHEAAVRLRDRRIEIDPIEVAAFLYSEGHRYDVWDDFVLALAIYIIDNYPELSKTIGDEERVATEVLATSGITQREFVVAKAFMALSEEGDVITLDRMADKSMGLAEGIGIPISSPGEIEQAVKRLNELGLGISLYNDLNDFMRQRVDATSQIHIDPTTWKGSVDNIAEALGMELRWMVGDSSGKGAVLPIIRPLVVSALREMDLSERDFVNKGTVVAEMKGRVMQFLQLGPLGHLHHFEDALNAYQGLLADGLRSIEDATLAKEILQELGIDESDIAVAWTYSILLKQKESLPTTEEVTRLTETHWEKPYDINRTVQRLGTLGIVLTFADAVSTEATPAAEADGVEEQEPEYADLFAQIGMKVRNRVPTRKEIFHFFTALPDSRRGHATPERHAYGQLMSGEPVIGPLRGKGPLLTGHQYREWFAERHGLAKSFGLNALEGEPRVHAVLGSAFDSADDRFEALSTDDEGLGWLLQLKIDSIRHLREGRSGMTALEFRAMREATYYAIALKGVDIDKQPYLFWFDNMERFQVGHPGSNKRKGVYLYEPAGLLYQAYLKVKDEGRSIEPIARLLRHDALEAYSLAHGTAAPFASKEAHDRDVREILDLFRTEYGIELQLAWAEKGTLEEYLLPKAILPEAMVKSVEAQREEIIGLMDTVLQGEGSVLVIADDELIPQNQRSLVDRLREVEQVQSAIRNRKAGFNLDLMSVSASSILAKMQDSKTAPQNTIVFVRGNELGNVTLRVELEKLVKAGVMVIPIGVPEDKDYIVYLSSLAVCGLGFIHLRNNGIENNRSLLAYLSRLCREMTGASVNENLLRLCIEDLQKALNQIVLQFAPVEGLTDAQTEQMHRLALKVLIAA